jgi:hypothetical protein
LTVGTLHVTSISTYSSDHVMPVFDAARLLRTRALTTLAVRRSASATLAVILTVAVVSVVVMAYVVSLPTAAPLTSPWTPSTAPALPVVDALYRCRMMTLSSVDPSGISAVVNAGNPHERVLLWFFALGVFVADASASVLLYAFVGVDHATVSVTACEALASFVTMVATSYAGWVCV